MCKGRRKDERFGLRNAFIRFPNTDSDFVRFMLIFRFPILLISLLISTPLLLPAQDGSGPEKLGTEGKRGACGKKGHVFAIAEEDPEFPGGKQKMKEFIQKELVYPEEAKKEGVEGQVIVSFVICKDGRISNIEILKGIGNGCDEAAKELIEKMPEWEAGEQRGRKVMVEVQLPITFQPD
jgi:TonB family protein